MATLAEHSVQHSKPMHIIRQLSGWPAAAQGSVMALGNFDGVHRGHQAVIAAARDIAAREGRPLSMMTFEPHPRRLFNPALPLLRIVPFAEKARLLRQQGVDYLYVAHFTHAFASLSADAFIRDILLEGLQVSHVVTGHNFHFGHRRDGDVAYLRAASATLGFGYTQVAAAGEAEVVYSSTAVRRALEAGDMHKAAQLLGRSYTMQGRVIHGDKRGRTIGFPTANIRPAPLFQPRDGVYAVRLHRAGGKCHAAVANLGVRPTMDGQRRLLEVHVLDAAPDLYGERVTVEFLHFIRAEQAFASLEALTAQITADAQQARRIHGTEAETERKGMA